MESQKLSLARIFLIFCKGFSWRYNCLYMHFAKIIFPSMKFNYFFPLLVNCLSQSEKEWYFCLFFIFYFPQSRHCIQWNNWYCLFSRTEMTKDQMVVDLAFSTKILLLSGIVLGSLSVGILGYAVVRYPNIFLVISVPSEFLLVIRVKHFRFHLFLYVWAICLFL